MRKKNKGFLLHAFGHKDLDYGKLAVCCALSIKSNLKNNNVSVVMDDGTKKWLQSSISDKILKTAFDKVIIAKEKFRSGKEDTLIPHGLHSSLNLTTKIASCLTIILPMMKLYY